jgi:hypothetical protein
MSQTHKTNGMGIIWYKIKSFLLPQYNACNLPYISYPAVTKTDLHFHQYTAWSAST